MELFILLLLALIVLGIAAPRWGFNSRDTFNSAEWGRRNEVSYPLITPKIEQVKHVPLHPTK